MIESSMIDDGGAHAGHDQVHNTDYHAAADGMDHSTLDANGHQYDLTDPSQAKQAVQDTAQYRDALRAGKLSQYENHSTDYGGGGRSHLLYDQARAKLANDFHNGEHTMTYDQQHIEAQRIVHIRATQTQSQWQGK